MADLKVLLVYDDAVMARYIKEKLAINRNYPVALRPTLSEGLRAFQESSFDIILVKSGFPDFGTVNFIKNIKKIDQDCVIIVFTDYPDSEEMAEISKLGIYDFIVNPVDLERLYFLMQRGSQLRLVTNASRKLNQGLQEQNVSLHKQNALLAKRIEDSTKSLARLYEDLRTTYMRTIKVLAQAIDAKDHYTHSHSESVGVYAVAIAEEMHLSVKDIETIRDACELHDLGKVGVEDRILTKPSSLTAEEWESVKRHPLIGAKILEPLTFLGNVIDLVKQHHEHYDGTGYPDGLRDGEILLGARILHVADAYEAMTSARSYRKVPFTKEEAIAEIRRNNGTQFDPKVVEAFLKVVAKF